MCNWTIKVKVDFQGLSRHVSNTKLSANINMGLSNIAEVAKLDGVTLSCQKVYEAGKAVVPSLAVKDMVNAVGTDRPATVTSITAADSYNVTLDYLSSSRTLSLTAASKSVSVGLGSTTIKSASQAYLAIMGTLSAQGSSPTFSSGQTVYITFDSMALPHLNPNIRSVTLYHENGSIINDGDIVAAGTKVRVVCRVYNNDANSSGEQFSMHFKLDKGTTRNITALSGGSYPTKVNGAIVSEAVDSTAGIPIVLHGTNNPNNQGSDTVIEYWATVNQANGGAVVLGQKAVDDMFGGEVSMERTLLGERTLTPGPGSLDPSNPGSDAGSAFHFVRRPVANANGWNSSPVSFTFFPGVIASGGFPEFIITKTGSALPEAVLTAANRTWTRTDDTASYPLALQGSDPDTGVVSQTVADTLRIDTAAPTASFDSSSGVLTVNDTPSDSSKATSGVWRLYRTAADGSGAQLVKTFGLTNGNGAASQAISGLINGYYVVEDAAGNQSAPVRVLGVQPPIPSRPSGSLPGGGVDPVGPPLGDGEPVPEPEVDESDDGTTHAVINETVTQVADPSGSLFGGSFDVADAEALMNYRYTFTTGVAGGLTQTTQLLAADGSALTAGSLPTTQPGSCLVRRVVTDKQGNTTTVNLTYRLVKPAYPEVYPGGPGTDPDAPDGSGGGNPGGDSESPKPPVDPVEPPTIGPDGTQHARVRLMVTEATVPAFMTSAGAQGLLLRHWSPQTVDGATPEISVDSLVRVADNSAVSRVDLSVPDNYLITYTLADAAGNTTVVELTYCLVASRPPLVVPEPSDDDLAAIAPPLHPVEPPYVDDAGNQHAVADDTMIEPVEMGVVMSETEIQAMVEERYAFLSAAGEDAEMVGFSVADMAGEPTAFIDKSLPASYTVRYKVADDAGDTTLLRLRYSLVADEQPVPPTPPLNPEAPDDEKPGSPVISVVDPDDPLPGRPLGPVSVQEDANGLRHAVIEDAIVVGLREGVMTPADFAALFAKRYDVASTLADGTITSSPVSLFDSEGLPVTSVDRSKPGVWQVEQVFSDSAGNTTTLRVTYDVRAEFVQTTLPAGGTRSGSSGGSLEGYGGHYTQLALAQTGDFFGPCPLHPLFVLLMVLASAYGMMKLRLESFARRRLLRRARTTACDGAADGARLAGAGDESAGGTSVASDAEELRRRMKLTDYAVFGLIGVAAVALATLALCPFDFLWASVVLLVCAAWLFLMHRKVRATNRKLAAV